MSGELAERLAGELDGAVGRDVVERFVAEAEARYGSGPAGVARVERFARQRLSALARAGEAGRSGPPVVLFLCVHNAGRSQMALGWFNHLAGGRAVAWSGGSAPAAEVNRAAVAAMNEVGIDISGEFPKPWTDEVARAVDVIVTMGCGDACPVYPGTRTEDWELADPAGQGIEAVRPIRDEIGRRVAALVASLGL